MKLIYYERNVNINSVADKSFTKKSGCVSTAYDKAYFKSNQCLICFFKEVLFSRRSHDGI